MHHIHSDIINYYKLFSSQVAGNLPHSQEMERSARGVCLPRIFPAHTYTSRRFSGWSLCCDAQIAFHSRSSSGLRLQIVSRSEIMHSIVRWSVRRGCECVDYSVGVVWKTEGIWKEVARDATIILCTLRILCMWDEKYNSSKCTKIEYVCIYLCMYMQTFGQRVQTFTVC